MSVGDLIEGYTTKEDRSRKQWDEFDGYVKQFQMPFFYVPGNHDLTNKTHGRRRGASGTAERYYHFVYKDVLFLCLYSEDPPDGRARIDQGAAGVAGEDARRTTGRALDARVPAQADLDGEGPGEERLGRRSRRLLAGRKYTVFCGHVHRYQKFVRNGTNYYQLATTGGGSRTARRRVRRVRPHRLGDDEEGRPADRERDARRRAAGEPDPAGVGRRRGWRGGGWRRSRHGAK